MYLRFGWVVGNVGLIGTLLIVTMSVSITFLTSLSIASIATDQEVRIGGAYYMISRSLGIEPGGAIGIPLYFAQALSVALYTVGFAESMVGAFPVLDQKWVGIATTVAVAIVALISARAAIKTQYVIMAAIGLSLLSLLMGSPLEDSHIEMWGAPGSASEPFWTVFAVFFPAVTGIMAGVNMSGDLKNPSKAIPYGTFAAIGVGYLIYMGLPIVLAGRVDAITLTEDPLIMRRISYWGDAILLGVWGATLSSAVGSILGASQRSEIERQYCEMIRDVYQQKRNVLVLHERKGNENPFGEQREIHVWWGGLKGNGGLMLILAYLLQSSVKWRNAEVHMKMVIDDASAVEEVHENLVEITDNIRIGAQVDVLVSEGRSFDQILHESSGDADLILMGMAPPENNFRSYYRSITRQIRDLPTTVLVLAAQDISFGEVLIQKDRMS